MTTNSLLDQAGNTLLEGFATEYLGRRGAVVAFLFIKTVVPFGGLSSLVPIGAYVMLASFFGWDGFPGSWPFYVGGCLSMLAGAAGLVYDLRQMANGRMPS